MDRYTVFYYKHRYLGFWPKKPISDETLFAANSKSNSGLKKEIKKDSGTENENILTQAIKDIYNKVCQDYSANHEDNSSIADKPYLVDDEPLSCIIDHIISAPENLYKNDLTNSNFPAAMLSVGAGKKFCNEQFTREFLKHCIEQKYLNFWLDHCLKHFIDNSGLTLEGAITLDSQFAIDSKRSYITQSFMEKTEHMISLCNWKDIFFAIINNHSVRMFFRKADGALIFCPNSDFVEIDPAEIPGWDGLVLLYGDLVDRLANFNRASIIRKDKWPNGMKHKFFFRIEINPLGETSGSFFEVLPDGLTDKGDDYTDELRKRLIDWRQKYVLTEANKYIIMCKKLQEYVLSLPFASHLKEDPSFNDEYAANVARVAFLKTSTPPDFKKILEKVKSELTRLQADYQDKLKLKDDFEKLEYNISFRTKLEKLKTLFENLANSKNFLERLEEGDNERFISDSQNEIDKIVCQLNLVNEDIENLRREIGRKEYKTLKREIANLENEIKKNEADKKELEKFALYPMPNFKDAVENFETEAVTISINQFRQYEENIRNSICNKKFSLIEGIPPMHRYIIKMVFLAYPELVIQIENTKREVGQGRNKKISYLKDDNDHFLARTFGELEAQYPAFKSKVTKLRKGQK